MTGAMRWSGAGAGIGAALGLMVGLLLDQLLLAVVVGLVVGGFAAAVLERERRPPTRGRPSAQ
jgi:hypothetical protein